MYPDNVPFPPWTRALDKEAVSWSFMSCYEPVFLTPQHPVKQEKSMFLVSGNHHDYQEGLATIGVLWLPEGTMSMVRIRISHSATHQEIIMAADKALRKGTDLELSVEQCRVFTNIPNQSTRYLTPGLREMGLEHEEQFRAPRSPVPLDAMVVRFPMTKLHLPPDLPRDENGLPLDPPEAVRKEVEAFKLDSQGMPQEPPTTTSADHAVTQTQRHLVNLDLVGSRDLTIEERGLASLLSEAILSKVLILAPGYYKVKRASLGALISLAKTDVAGFPTFVSHRETCPPNANIRILSPLGTPPELNAYLWLE